MSAIAAFYKNKTIFLTGGTGFIGKLLIEQLLRKTEPRKLYLLIREKKGVPSDVRMEKLFQDVVFDRLKATNRNYLEKVCVIPGDLSMDNLGITESYSEKLCNETEVVIHGGATVALNEKFKPAMDVNLKGSLSMLALCHKIRKLQVFAHVSTAYSFCPYPEIKEELYNIHTTCDELLKLTENLTEAEINAKIRKILGKWPNPYTLSKAVVEEAVNNQDKDFPAAIIRPSIIMGTYNEPIPGWIDNYYGSTGLLAAIASGIVTAVNIDPKRISDIVPGDMVASCVLAAAYKTALSRCAKINPIYNMVAYQKTRPNWKDFRDIAFSHPQFNSVNKMIWPTHAHLIANPYLFEFYSFLFHLIPYFGVDVIHKILNKKSRMLRTYKKVHSFMESLSYFGTHSWNFSNDNTVKLWNELSEEDKRLFNFNTKCIDWQCYITDCFTGILTYLFRQTPDLANGRYPRYTKRAKFSGELSRKTHVWLPLKVDFQLSDFTENRFRGFIDLHKLPFELFLDSFWMGKLLRRGVPHQTTVGII